MKLHKSIYEIFGATYSSVQFILNLQTYLLLYV